jgi:zinc protease
LLGAFVVAPAAFAGPGAAASPAPAIRVLDNGVRLIVEPRPGSRTFALRLVVAGGACEDPSGQQGASSLLVRTLLRSSEMTTASERDIRLESAGVSLDGASGLLGLEFQAGGPAAGLDLAVTLLADLLLHPKFAPDEVARETALARRALEAAKDDPSTARRRATGPLLFGDHCAGRFPPEKSADWLAGIGPDELRRLHRERLAGSRLILAVAGDVSPEKVEWLASGLFGTLPRGTPSPTALPAPAPLASEIRTRVRQRTSQPELFIALPTAGVSDADDPATDLLAHILGGFQERLSAEIREKRGWAYWLGTVDQRWPGAGSFGVVTAVPKAHLAEAETIIRAQLERIATEPPAEEEVERARRFLATQRARESQSSSGSALRLARAALTGKPLRTLDEEAARDAAVTPEQIRALARRLIDSSKLLVLTMY